MYTVTATVKARSPHIQDNQLNGFPNLVIRDNAARNSKELEKLIILAVNLHERKWRDRARQPKQNFG